jgi:hypothetical protein
MKTTEQRTIDDICILGTRHCIDNILEQKLFFLIKMQ